MINRITPLLLFIGLGFWSCEEDNEELFVMSDDFRRCAPLKWTYNYPDGTQSTHIWQWEDSVVTEAVQENDFIATHHYNIYGFQVYTESMWGIIIREYIDGWKRSKIISINTDGDTTTNRIYNWDGLTRSFEEDSVLHLSTHNEYGKNLHNQTIDVSTGHIIQESTYEYLDDGRRQIRCSGGDSEEITEWDGDSFTEYYYSGGQLLSKTTGTINEYGEIIKYTGYNCPNDNPEECEYIFDVYIEEDCDYFEPIPLSND